MSKLIVLVGNIGCGKSTEAARLAKETGAVVVNMDSIQQMVSGGVYGAYDVAKKELYQDIEHIAIKSALERGLDVVIDRTNMDKKRRARFIAIGKCHGAEICSFDFGPGTESDLERRLTDPRDIPAEKWREVFESMSNAYEQPSSDEGFTSMGLQPHV